MNILHIIFSFELGGTENMLVDIANEQAKQNRVTIVIINDVYDVRLLELLDAKVQVIRLERAQGSKNPLALLKVKFLTWSLRPRIVHLHDQQMLKLFPFKFIRLFKLLYTVHTTGTSYGKEIDNADYVCSISNAVKEDLKERTGIDSIVVHNGIVFNNVAMANEKSISTDGVFKVLQIGRFSIREKGQDILVEALSVLRNKGFEITVDFIGDGPDRVLIENKIKECAVEDFTVLHGSLPKNEIYKKIAEYDLVCQPSRIEGFGLTMIEAMAAKVPVVASDIEGPREVLGNGKYGFLFQSENSTALADTLESVINRDYPADLTEVAYRYAYDCYSIAEVAQKYVDLA